MNKANKITMSRVIMSVIIIALLLFPFDQMGIDFPTYLIGKMVDAISDKLLTNSVLIILGCSGKISAAIVVVIIARDIVVDSIKMVIGNKGHAVAAIGIAKVKTATLMIGIILTLFYNLPFELISLRISDFLLVLAAILSVISGVKYYMMAKPYLKDR